MAGHFIGLGRDNIGDIIVPQVLPLRTGYEWRSAVMTLGTRINVGTKESIIPIFSEIPNADFVEKTGTQATPIAGPYPAVDVADAPDVGYKPVSGISLDAQRLTLEKIAVIIPVADCVIEDLPNAAALEEMIISKAQQGIARRFDQAVLLGTNAPASYGPGIVADATNAGNRVEVPAGGTPSDVFDAINQGISMVEEDNYVANGVAAATSVRGIFRAAYQSRSGQVAVINPDDLQNPPVYAIWGLQISTALAFNGTNVLAVVGDWSNVYWGVRNNFNVSVSNTASYTKADGTTDNMWQQDITGFRVYLRAGYAVVRANGADTYPLAVIEQAEAAGGVGETRSAGLIEV